MLEAGDVIWPSDEVVEPWIDGSHYPMHSPANCGLTRPMHISDGMIHRTSSQESVKEPFLWWENWNFKVWVQNVCFQASLYWYVYHTSGWRGAVLLVTGPCSSWCCAEWGPQCCWEHRQSLMRSDGIFPWNCSVFIIPRVTKWCRLNLKFIFSKIRVVCHSSWWTAAVRYTHIKLILSEFDLKFLFWSIYISHLSTKFLKIAEYVGRPVLALVDKAILLLWAWAKGWLYQLVCWIAISFFFTWSMQEIWILS